ncbi:hypothetical protein I302_104193 [Kwoniella bestiolae CBS 10118]|uniref:Uncharacterized protein n=1 Tax=Kwoniella bestiolae CBS 10118 TaxID=1296100 RepID=A0A1B9GAK4_9TREE|nr:hypothetical protein I302_02902 [Kwoniella bestiolae CBS 10118]OCF28051.1 hypothetical protein I302_02902 [Kwoniella bestiolae CBS 10118]
MAPLLLTHFRPKQRSILSTLFTATFLGAVIVVAFPCPVKSHGEARLDGGSMGSIAQNQDRSRSEVVVMMNQRGKRRFLEER